MPFRDRTREGVVDKVYKEMMLEQRDEGVCKMCGSCKNLTVHHMDRNKLKIYDVNNIMILCVKCHRKIHSGDK